MHRLKWWKNLTLNPYRIEITPEGISAMIFGIK